MDLARDIGILPQLDVITNIVSCQCEIGPEKLMSAPPFKMIHPPIPEEDQNKDSVGQSKDSVGQSKGSIGQSRHQTAPILRDKDQYKCPLSHILVTFKSPINPDQVFNKVLPANTLVRFAKRKLSKLLSMPSNCLILVKNRMILKDDVTLAEVETDTPGTLAINVYTEDDELELKLGGLPKDSYVEDVLKAAKPRKQTIPFIAVKFRIKNQNESFTRSYHSIMKIHEIKKNLAGVFQTVDTNLVLLRGDYPLMDRMLLMNLDYDKFGIVELELLTKNKEKLKLEKLYRDNIVNDVLTVTMPYGDTTKQIIVEIINKPIEKPYFGGYRNVKTGQVYHHAHTQTPQRPEKVPPEMKNSRDTQTGAEKATVYDTCYSRATQMTSNNVFIPNVTDRVMDPKPYETYEEMIARLNHHHYATVIQSAYRHYQFRCKVARWLADCMERIARMKEEDRREREALEQRLRRDLITKTFPKTREDFDQLYALVDHWKQKEMARISALHAKGPKIAEFTLLLDKEVELLRCIEAYRVQVREDDKKRKRQLFLEEISKPIAWFGKDGQIITMETIEIQKAKKLRDLYTSFIRTDLKSDERLELLVDMKMALQTFRHPLAEEIIGLLDQEADLVVRRCSDHQLQFLRERIAQSVYQFIKTSDLNSGVTKCKDLRDFKHMGNRRLFLCEMCQVLKHIDDFPIYSKMEGVVHCKSCSWKEPGERLWIDMTPYTFVLRAIQREERRRKCWSSIAFIIQARDIWFLVEKLWHRHSAISECEEITELRLSRWNVNHDWSPWNCFLVTVQEMKAHTKLENPEEVYDEELVQKVKNINNMAKAHFEQSIIVNKRYTQSGDWHAVRAPAVAFVNGVTPCK